MSADQDKPTATTVSGLIPGLIAIAKNSLGLLLSRIELASLELSEVRNQLLRLVWILGLALLATWFAIAYGTLLVVYLAWASMGWEILCIMTLGFTVLAIGLLLYARQILRQDKLSLPATMLAVQTDREMLDSMR